MAQWPAWELDLLDQYFAREPPVLERMEDILARVASMYATVHGEKGRTPPTPRDFMPHLKAWPSVQDGRYSDIDKEVLAALL